MRSSKIRMLAPFQDSLRSDAVPRFGGIASDFENQMDSINQSTILNSSQSINIAQSWYFEWRNCENINKIEKEVRAAIIKTHGQRDEEAKCEERTNI